MARGTITVYDVERSGLTPLYSTGNTGDGDKFQNDGNTFLHVTNAGETNTLTISTPGTVDGLAVADRTVTLNTDCSLFIGPFSPAQYNQVGTDDGYVYISYNDSGDTPPQVGAFRL